MATQDIEAFRKELRSWLAANLPQELRPETPPRCPKRNGFHAFVPGKRSWPKRAGWASHGRSNTADGALRFRSRSAYTEEMARAEAPEVVGSLGIGIAGPSLIGYGTEAQKQRFLRRILTAEDLWCIGFSEPSAGSDLASLRTKAILEGDSFVMDGQKVWTTLAHHANWCMVSAVPIPSRNGATVSPACSST